MDIVRMIRNLIHDDADTFSEKTQVEVKRLTSSVYWLVKRSE